MTRRRLKWSEPIAPWSEPIAPDPRNIAWYRKASTPFGTFLLSWTEDKQGNPEGICWVSTPWETWVPSNCTTIDQAIDEAEDLYRSRLKEAWFDCRIFVFADSLLVDFSLPIDEKMKTHLTKFGNVYGRNFAFETAEVFRLYVSERSKPLTVASELGAMLVEYHDLAFHVNRLG